MIVAIEVTGERELQAAFVKLEQVLSDLSPVFEKIGDEFFPIVRQRFEQQGPGWQPLSEAYAKRKASLYGGAQILRATDRLYESFQKQGAESINRVGPQEAEFGSSVPYGIYHQEGAGRLPQRTIIEITDQDEGRFAVTAVKVLDERIRELGFETT